jgi:hypothetical protein
MFYVVINSNGIEVRESKEMLTLKEMQNLVGVEGEPAYIEVASYQNFSDPEISMICDDEFLLKHCQPTCLIEGHVLHGQVLILGTDRSQEDFCLLTKDQVDIVKSEIQLFPKKPNV